MSSAWLPPLTFQTGAGPSGASGAPTAATPVSLNIPWISVKNFQNHTNGSTQTGSASSNPDFGGTSAGGLGGLGSVGGIPVFYILLGAGAWLLLR
ncbi:hypothetical protein [Undibacterium sp.]|uniref:hypothetical protein n=1 Tax=Undibacterium sp. TaxID=1914977 RepID=UPI00272F2437|nr:hypothetical protein [Undibacterium sp.]MDP1978042.1 hypothetical protein [Undibacterium sp.]